VIGNDTNTKQQLLTGDNTMKSGSTKWCAMELAKDNYAHNIPKEWLTEKVWEVLLNNPVYKDYVKKNQSFVSKKLHEKPLTKPNKQAKFNSLKETKTTNSKGDNSMNKKIDELLTLVKNLTDRVAELETKQTAPRFKKLREHKEEPKTEKVVKVEKKVEKKVEAPKAPKAPKVKTANKEQKAEIVKLQKKAQAGKKSLTAKQMEQYKRLWHAKWQEVNKTIDINDKAARSLAFAKGRIACLKKARTY
jgi:hypothetical protein